MLDLLHRAEAAVVSPAMPHDTGYRLMSCRSSTQAAGRRCQDFTCRRPCSILCCRSISCISVLAAASRLSALHQMKWRVEQGLRYRYHNEGNKDAERSMSVYRFFVTMDCGSS